MPKFLRNAILLGMGAVYYSKEKVEELVKELGDSEKINPEEGKKMVKEIIQKAEEYKKQQEKELTKMVSKIIKDLGVVTKNDIEAIKKQVKPKTPAKKTSKKK